VNPAVRFAALVSNVLPGTVRLAIPENRRIWVNNGAKAQSRPYCWHQNAKSDQGRRPPENMVFKALTMIKGTLRLRFYSMRQTDRMGSGTVM
jgi:hypothetical protein